MTNQNNTDIRELLAQSRRGDAKALNCLCTMLREQVLQYVMGKLHDGDDSDELAQEVVLWFIRNYNDRLHDENIPALLASKAFFMLRSHYRAKYARREVALEHVGDLSDESAVEAVDETFDRNEAWTGIQAALGQIPETYQDVITRKYFKDMSFKAIADELHISEENVRQRHKRGLQALRKHIGKEKIKGKR